MSEIVKYRGRDFERMSFSGRDTLVLVHTSEDFVNYGNIKDMKDGKVPYHKIVKKPEVTKPIDAVSAVKPEVVFEARELVAARR